MNRPELPLASAQQSITRSFFEYSGLALPCAVRKYWCSGAIASTQMVTTSIFKKQPWIADHRCAAPGCRPTSPSEAFGELLGTDFSLTRAILSTAAQLDNTGLARIIGFALRFPAIRSPLRSIE